MARSSNRSVAKRSQPSTLLAARLFLVGHEGDKMDRITSSTAGGRRLPSGEGKEERTQAHERAAQIWPLLRLGAMNQQVHHHAAFRS